MFWFFIRSVCGGDFFGTCAYEEQGCCSWGTSAFNDEDEDEAATSVIVATSDDPTDCDIAASNIKYSLNRLQFIRKLIVSGSDQVTH